MNFDEVGKKVYHIISGLLKISIAEIHESTVFFEKDSEEKVDVDDLSMIEVILDIEQEFEIDIDDNDWDQFTTVGELIAYVYKKINSGEG